MKQTLYHGSYVSVPNPLTGVANDQVIDTVEDYYAGRITSEQALGQLRFAKPTHQMCIRRQTIIDRCLRFIAIEPVEKGNLQ